MLAVALALAGIALGLRVASPGEYDTELGRVSVRVTPATHGQVEAYIPLADWGVRFHAFRAPMRLHLEPRTVERDVVIRAASGARAPVSATEAGLRTAVKKTVLRTLRFALGGAALLALMLGLGLAAFGVRRRRVLVGAPVAVLAIAAVACAGTLFRRGPRFDERALDHPTFYARGAELVQLLDAATNARAAGDGYASKVQGAVSGFASLLTDPTAGRVDDTRPALLASDLHNNRVALDSLRDYARDKPVFFVGDFGRHGQRRRGAPARARHRRAGRDVVAVSGNHDSTIFMRSLARRGVTVLTRDGVMRADGSHGAAVRGRRRPARRRLRRPARVARRPPGRPAADLLVRGAARSQQATDAAQQDLLRWYDGLRVRPTSCSCTRTGSPSGWPSNCGSAASRGR